MPKQPRSRWRNRAEAAPAWLLLTALAWTPLPLARRLAEGLALGLRRWTPRWRRTALRNLELAFPERDAAWREGVLRESYRNLGRVLLALAKAPRLTAANIGDWIEYEGYEHFRDALAKGRGVLFLTAHLGNWELSVAAHALFGHPMRMLVRPLDNPLLDRLIERRRTLHGNRPIDKNNAAREALKALRANQAVGILADQNAAGDDGLFVDFFGRPARSTKSVALLAARTGAAVIPGFAFWNPLRSRYVLKFYPPLVMADGGDREADLRENTQRCQTAIERAVRERPEQWLWMHRRWKSRPPGEEILY
ncbi:MAG: lipid A biosynthesis acyltransferase [Acidobacteria bacterium]|nr:lipid A biosynthesis acyltransferase [Acidobacteriota bacterium]